MRCTHGSHRSRFRESLDARPVLDLPGLRSPLLDDISPPEDGLCDPPAQWTEGTLPSRRHLGRHVSECPRSLSGMARETPGWIAMWRSKFCHKPFTENPDRLVRFERKTKSSPHSTTPRGRTRRSDGRIFSTPSALPPHFQDLLRTLNVPAQSVPSSLANTHGTPSEIRVRCSRKIAAVGADNGTRWTSPFLVRVPGISHHPGQYQREPGVTASPVTELMTRSGACLRGLNRPTRSTCGQISHVLARVSRLGCPTGLSTIYPVQ